jgi:nicotinate phosphoribosyltransferase
MVYKVCEFKGTPRIKISEEPSKTTIPGNKKVMRAFSDSGLPLFDVLCLSDESVEEAGASMTVFD